MTRFRLGALLAALTLLPVASALAGGSRPTVAIRNFAFGPRVLHIRRGTTILVVNRDDTDHSFTSVSGRFEIPELHPHDRGGTVRFNRPGTYHYFCAFHPYMTGEIVVR